MSDSGFGYGGDDYDDGNEKNDSNDNRNRDANKSGIDKGTDPRFLPGSSRPYVQPDGKSHQASAAESESGDEEKDREDDDDEDDEALIEEINYLRNSLARLEQNVKSNCHNKSLKRKMSSGSRVQHVVKKAKVGPKDLSVENGPAVTQQFNYTTNSPTVFLSQNQYNYGTAPPPPAKQVK